MLGDARAIQESSMPVEAPREIPPPFLSRPTPVPRWQVTPPYHGPEAVGKEPRE
jgi:hypothetical protein